MNNAEMMTSAEMRVPAPSGTHGHRLCLLLSTPVADQLAEFLNEVFSGVGV